MRREQGETATEVNSFAVSRSRPASPILPPPSISTGEVVCSCSGRGG
jgi:hypothetical protein